MNNKILNYAIFVIALIPFSLFLISCNFTTNKSDLNYWFQEYNKETIKYDETEKDGSKDLDNTVGTYWTMTINKDCKISINISVDCDLIFSGVNFYINNQQVKSEVNTDIYTCVYKDLDLKKGDKLKFRAYWTNIIKAEEKPEGFKMTLFTITEESNNYIISNIK